MTEIALIYALKEELKPLLKDFRGNEHISTCRARLDRGTLYGIPAFLCRTGVGMPNAHEGTELLTKNAKPSVVVSVGFGGACHPELKTGDVVLVNEIRSETPTDRFISEPVWRKKMESALKKSGLTYREGSLMTAWKLADQKQKEAFGKAGHLAIDMETAAIAAIVRRAQIPFVSLRVIFDPLMETLPLTDLPEGSHPGLFVIKNPKMLLKIPKYFQMNLKAQKTLSKAVEFFLKEIQNDVTTSHP